MCCFVGSGLVFIAVVLDPTTRAESDLEPPRGAPADPHARALALGCCPAGSRGVDMLAASDCVNIAYVNADMFFLLWPWCEQRRKKGSDWFYFVEGPR